MDDKTDREKKIDNFVENIFSQKQWKKKMDKKINKWKKKYSKELEDYEFIFNSDEFYQLKIGGYIRYFNLNNELKWGGILLKVFKQEDRNLMVLGNSEFKRMVVSFDKNYVFYKTHKTANDINRKLFISFLDKYKFED
jgi:hypothetical protein